MGDNDLHEFWIVFVIIMVLYAIAGTVDFEAAQFTGR